MARVVVTGGTGHLGANLVRQLLARGDEVRVVAKGPTDAIDGLGVEVLDLDVRDEEALRGAFAGAEIVYHLAAVISVEGDPTGLVRSVNVDGARAAARASLAAGVRRHVHTSSVHAFDHHPPDAPLDETRGRPGPSHPAYDRSKADGEAAVREVVAQGLDAVIVNPSGVIGPEDHRPSRMGQLFLELARGAHRALPAGGFDWVDVRDVASSTIAAAERGRTGENYLLGGWWHSTRQLAELASKVTGARAPTREIPIGVARALSHVVAPVMRLAGRQSEFTPEAVHALGGSRNVRWTKAATELGHAPRPTERTVRDLYACFARRGVIRLPALEA